MNTQPLTSTQAIKGKRHALKVSRGRRRLIITTISAITITLLLLGVIFGIASVRGDSMNPALNDKDSILFFRIGSPLRGDIIIFHADDRYGDDYIKRVVGLPGETVNIDRNGRVLIDGEILAEPYAPDKAEKANSQLPITLANDEYFVLGDNRKSSFDSRYFGPIKKDRVIGKAILVVRACNL